MRDSLLRVAIYTARMQTGTHKFVGSDCQSDPNGAQLRSETLVDFRGLPLSFLEAETRIWRRGRVRYW